MNQFHSRKGSHSEKATLTHDSTRIPDWTANETEVWIQDIVTKTTSLLTCEMQGTMTMHGYANWKSHTSSCHPDSAPFPQLTLRLTYLGYVHINPDESVNASFSPRLGLPSHGDGAFRKTLSQVDKLQDAVFALECGLRKRRYSRTMRDAVTWPVQLQTSKTVDVSVDLFVCALTRHFTHARYEEASVFRRSEKCLETPE